MQERKLPPKVRKYPILFWKSDKDHMEKDASCRSTRKYHKPKNIFSFKSFFYSSLFSPFSRIKVFKRHLKGYSICSSLFLIFFMIAMKKKLQDDKNDSIRLNLLVRIYSFSYVYSTHLNEHIRLVETPL